MCGTPAPQCHFWGGTSGTAPQGSATPLLAWLLPCACQRRSCRGLAIGCGRRGTGRVWEASVRSASLCQSQSSPVAPILGAAWTQNGSQAAITSCFPRAFDYQDMLVGGSAPQASGVGQWGPGSTGKHRPTFSGACVWGRVSREGLGPRLVVQFPSRGVAQGRL